MEEVATFKKPSGGGNGKYELKEKYYADYCPFFYHYSKSDQSKASRAHFQLTQAYVQPTVGSENASCQTANVSC